MIELEIATEDLLKWARYADEIRARTPASIASALNAFGDNMKAGMIDYLAAATGLDPEQVRSVTDIDEASSGHLQWHMDASRALLTDADEWRRPWDSRPSDSQFEQQILLNIETQPGCCEVCSEIADEGPYTAAQIREMAAKWKDFTPTGLSWLDSLTRNPVTALIHPNAVLEGSRFVGYGQVTEMVRAVFAADAICAETTVKRLTIGPNHPMLTRRGFIKASSLREGDELLYDRRCDSSTVVETNLHFDQMPLVEDAFEALAAVSQGALSRFATANDLHGDAVFCQREVDVVRAAGSLLRVLDPCGVEQFSELGFPLADVQLLGKSSLSTLRTLFKAALATLTGFMSVCNLRLALSGSHTGPSDFLLFGGGSELSADKKAPDRAAANLKSFSNSVNALARFVEASNFFRWDRVVAVGHVRFSGLAFDASTTTGLYNSDGYLVHNCHCATSQWQGSDHSIPVRFDGDDKMMTPDEIGRELGKAVLHDWIEDIRAIVKD